MKVTLFTVLIIVLISCNLKTSTEKPLVINGVQIDSISQKVKMNDINVYFRGNQQSDVTLWYISDYYCESCISFQPFFYLLYNKYKTKIRFAYFNISTDSPLKGMAAHCAYLQNYIWIMDEYLYNNTNNDTTAILNIAQQTGLDIDQFSIDLKDTTILNTYLTIRRQIFEAGIVKTPTIIVNNRLFENPDIETIQQYIEHLL